MSECEEILMRNQNLLNEHARKVDKRLEFGTAGFRTKADLLDHIMFRMGLLAALRSKDRKSAIGVMITASHNQEADNGVKLVDPAGEMLASTWEKYATIVGNCEDSQLAESLNVIIAKENIDLNEKCHVIVGRDTRKSSPALAKAVVEGVKCFEGEVKDYGIITTPILHFMVVCVNTNGEYGMATEEGYYSKITSAFRKIVEKRSNNGNYKPKITVDASNGVGAKAMVSFMQYLNGVLDITLVNDGSTGILNYQAGADYVKVNQRGCENIKIEAGVRYASLDGDADRLIYFYYDKDLKFHMLDGDKIAVLIADYLGRLVKASKLDIKLGLVQTAYANGSSTNYIRDVLGIQVSCTPTGVKYLHHEALNYDIGVYFEANGHGTVVFNDKATGLIKTATENPTNCNPASFELAQFMDLINSTVGDGISDMLTIEAILQAKGWNAEDWDQLYTDLPNRLMTVRIKDRYSVKTTDAERICEKPEGLQQCIDSLVSKYNYGRSFVRPSGTEDLIRVYAEADTKENADLLAVEVAQAVYEFCSGIGDKPTI